MEKPNVDWIESHGMVMRVPISVNSSPHLNWSERQRGRRREAHQAQKLAAWLSNGTTAQHM